MSSEVVTTLTWKSDSLGKLAGALAKAQSEFNPISRSREVKAGQYSFTYAPLDEVLDATRAALTGNGLALTQLILGTDLLTTLIHTSGEWVSSSVSIAPIPAKIQEVGSRLTYLRRYAIAAILGVAPEEDDDGGPGDRQDYQTQTRAPAAKAYKPERKSQVDPNPTVIQDFDPGEPPVPAREPGQDDEMPSDLRLILNRIEDAKNERDLAAVAVDAGQLEPSLLGTARAAYKVRLAALRGAK